MNNKLHVFLSAICIVSIFFTSCNDDDKDTNEVPTGAVTTADQFAEFENATREINTLMQESFSAQFAANRTSKSSAKTTNCGTVIQQDTGANTIITIDFDANCTLDSNDKISGIMRISFNLDAFANNNLEINYTLEDFKFNDITVNGTAVSKFSTDETNSNFSFVTDSKYTFTWNTTISATTETSLITELVFENNTNDPAGFESYTQISGTSAATFSNNDRYTTAITTPLRINSGCEYVVSGVVVTNSNSQNTTLDYGNGDCDNKATLTDNDGNETIIEL